MTSETEDSSDDVFPSDPAVIEKEYHEFEDAAAFICDSVADLLDADGNLDASLESWAIAIAEAAVVKLKQDGIVSEYFPGQHNIGIRFTNGFYYIWQPPVPDRDSSGGTTQLDISDNVNDFILAFDPFENETFTAGGSPRGAHADTCRGYVRNTVSPAISDTALSNENVTIDALKDLQNGELFLWHGHGGYGAQFGVHLATGEKLEGVSAYAKALKGSIAGVTAGYQNRDGVYLAVNADFFRSDTDFTLEHGFAYLAACESGYDDTLADALIDKGAEAVFVNRGSAPISSSYDYTMFQFIMIAMAAGEDEIYHTAGEALAMADAEIRARYLQSDNFTWPANASPHYVNNQLTVNQGVFPAIVGDETYTLVAGVKGRLMEDVSGTLQPFSAEKLEHLSVRIGDTQGRIEADGTFYINKLMPSAQGKSYTMEILCDGKVQSSVPDIIVISHRFTDLGDVGVSLDAEDPVRSACIAENNGITYILDEYGAAGFGLDPFPVDNAMYDYVCSFAFYHGKVYYCCKEAGTSGYHMALYEANPDGTSQTLLYAPDQEEPVLNHFALQGSSLYFAERSGYGPDASHVSWYQIDLNDYMITEVADVPDQIELTLNDFQGCYFFQGNRIYATTYTYDGRSDLIIVEHSDGSLHTFVDNAGTDIQLEAVIPISGTDDDAYIYYSTGENGYRQYSLYRASLKTGNEELIGTRPGVGGGGYFAW